MKIIREGFFLCIEIKSRIAMAKAAFSKKKSVFSMKLDLNLRQKLLKSYVWSITLYDNGA